MHARSANYCCMGRPKVTEPSDSVELSEDGDGVESELSESGDSVESELSELSEAEDA